MDAAALALILIVALVALGLVVLMLTLGRNPERMELSRAGLTTSATPLDNRFEDALPAAPAELHPGDLDKRVAFKLQPLPHRMRADFRAAWAELERRFPDDPVKTTREAHVLALEVMKARGYPVSDPSRARADELPADPEELAATMGRFRNLFDTMIDLPQSNRDS